MSNDNNNGGGNSDDYSFYPYDPSIAVAGLSCGLFGAALLWSTFMTIKTRSWIWIVQLVTIIMELVGYASRIASAKDNTNLTLYALQFCLIILAPIIMAGAIYVVFGRIVFHVIPAQDRTTGLLWIPPRWITPIFVTFDIVSLIVQLIGAAVVAATRPTDDNAANNLNMGKNVALAGLAIQIAAFGLFSIIAVRFHFISQRFEHSLQSRLAVAKGREAEINTKWRFLLYAVNISCLFVLIRSVYRVVEFAQGPLGVVTQKEFYMYVLDALPVFLVTLAFCVIFPGSFLPHMGFRVPKNRGEELGSDGSTLEFREI
ncbi:RTA1-domain-containing protein [Hypoxylon trugodes]|uniref:RTA1-domain-containing protein n=1 Tax=Hypoxylon trugodes TaxID=326681 RepID=UPI0021A1D28F|nr:RTA1-domain-containing protein [Hypoxylon trugodes]KAI1384711.1 RTA1-domain-containing protein [Hypoxylon trugodes]